MRTGGGRIAVVVGLALASLGACGTDGGGAYEARDLRSGAPVSVEDLRGAPALLVS